MDSTNTLPQIATSQAQKEVTANDNFAAASPAMFLARNADTSGGLVWGYLGGRWGGTLKANGTITLVASTTNYLVREIATGDVLLSDGSPDLWADTTNYQRLYAVTTSAAAVTSWQDHRGGPSGLLSGGGESGSASELVNLQTGTSYTFVSGDRGKLVTHSNAAAIADTLPQAGASFPHGWFADVQNRGAGTVTITPTTSTIDGAASLTLTTAQGVRIVSDGTNYFTQRGRGSSSALSDFTEAINTSSPNATIPVASLTATNAAAAVDAAIVPKGTGALLGHVPTGTSAGGNKRGSSAVDWQLSRSTAAQVASGNGSVVAGGNNNTASGLTSAVTGGVGNTASGQSSTAGGDGCTASGIAATAYGTINTASATSSACLGGSNNTASGSRGATVGGEQNVASGQYSFAHGYYASTRGLHAAKAHASGQFAAAGDAQELSLVLRRSTTDATPTVLTADSFAAGAANLLVLPNSSACTVRGTVVARDTATGDVSSWTFEASIKRGANAAATAMVAACTPVLVAQDAGASTWALSVTADTTNGALQVQGTGEAATTIRWVCVLHACQVA